MEQGEVFHVAVGTVEGQPAVLGFASHRVHGTQHRTAVHVRSAAARRRIASALFRLAETEAVAAGAGSINVSASLAAVKFYKANGFEEVGRVPHIHAVYGEQEISVEVETGRIHGDFPPRALKPVLEWMNLHTAELLENWQLAKQGQPLKRIAPLE